MFLIFSKLKAEDTQNVNLSEVKKLEESVDEEKVIVKETKAAKIVSKIEKAIKKLSNNDEKQSKKLSKKKEKSEKNSNLKRKREEIAETEANDVNNETSKENVTFEVETEGSLLTQNKKVKGSPPKRFQRVDPNEISFLDERLKDNQFLSKGGAEGSYGHKAHLDLIAVKGKDFRKGKDKKKKGSYKGGQIDFSSHSIKFNLDD
ncbi:hypothetical protein HK099_000739 [Clydaea vesicula]|uniref:Srp40 C-terminal domain-containing protein n=1 Tax=Clydaea vesicula TaxID=447962 RepID=A0AAD5TXG1_9FUNG|nr:hypothetical protein HK099_000739 [Clydaea vesicula]